MYISIYENSEFHNIIHPVANDKCNDAHCFSLKNLLSIYKKQRCKEKARRAVHFVYWGTDPDVEEYNHDTTPW